MLIKKMFCQICSFLFFCTCVGDPPFSRKHLPIIYPDKDLKEIIILIDYYPEDSKALEELKEELEKEFIERQNCLNDGDRTYERCRGSRLFTGETLEEALRTRFSVVGKERFSKYSHIQYCYNKTEDKSYSINKNFKARLYSKAGEILTESFLRMKKDNEYNHYTVKVYLPYHDEGHKIVFVRLNGKREVILYEKEMLTQPYLEEISLPIRGFHWRFSEERECHSSPPYR